MSLSRLTTITGPGIATDTNLVGNNANFTGVTTTGTSLTVGVTTIHSTLAEVHNIKSTGIITATGANFSGNVSIGGTLTYEDVTNIDSVGIITGKGADINGDLDVDGHTNLDNVSVAGVSTFSDTLRVGAGVTIHTSGESEFAGVSTFYGSVGAAIHLPTNKALVLGANYLYGSIYNTGSQLNFRALNSYRFRVWDGGGMEDWLTVTGPGGIILLGGSTMGVPNPNKTPGIQLLGASHQIKMLSSAPGSTTLTERFRLSQSGFNFTGLSTHTGNFDLDGDLDVDGHTNLDNVSVAGVSTFSNGLFLPDDKQFKLGNTAASPDLKIYHNTVANTTSPPNHLYPNSNYIDSVAASNLFIRTSAAGIYLGRTDGAHAASFHTTTAGVVLYYNASGGGGEKFRTVAGGIDVTGDVTLADSIIHDGDTDTKIRFPSNDQISFETGGVDRGRFDNDGNFLIGTTSHGNAGSGARHLVISGPSNQGLTINSTNTSGTYRDCNIYFGYGTSTNDMAKGQFTYSGNGDYFHMSVGNSAYTLAKSFRLSSDGTVRFDSTPTTTNSISLRIQSHKTRTVDDNNGIVFFDESNHSQAAIAVQKKSTSNATSDLVFRTSSGQVVGTLQGIPERLRITSDGDVNVATGHLQAQDLKLGLLADRHPIIQRAVASSGSQSLSITGGSGYSDHTGSAQLPTDAKQGALISLGSGNPTSDVFGGGIKYYTNGHTNPNNPGTGNQHVFYTRSGVDTYSERFRITEDGQLLLGETNPLDSNVAIQFRKDNAGSQSRFIFRNRGNNGSSRVRLVMSTLNRAANGDIYSGMEQYQSGGMAIFNGQSDTSHCNIGFFAGNWQPITLKNGNVSGGDAIHCRAYWGTSNGIQMEVGGPQSGTHKSIRFYTSHYGGERGYIGVTLGGTSYNSSSDYRMKQDVVDLTGAIDRVKSFKPRRFKWKEDPTYTVDGFLAHEASTVVPESVVGEKDAVDSNGDPEYQVMDNSKLVPVLTAALKEAIAKIETLETKVATLEGS